MPACRCRRAVSTAHTTRTYVHAVLLSPEIIRATERKKNQIAFTAQPGNVVKFDLHFIPGPAPYRRSYSRPPPSSPATTSRAVPWKHVLLLPRATRRPAGHPSELASSVITRHSIVFVKALHTPPAACPSRRRRNQPEIEREPN